MPEMMVSRVSVGQAANLVLDQRGALQGRGGGGVWRHRSRYRRVRAQVQAPVLQRQSQELAEDPFLTFEVVAARALQRDHGLICVLMITGRADIAGQP